MNRRDAESALASLGRIGRRHEPGLASPKASLLERLSRGRLRSGAQVLRLHELLEYLEAYADDRRVHDRARRMLREFAARSDLRRHRRALAGSGIAGTDTPYRFFWPTAHWISRHWPGALILERDDADHARAILAALPQLLDQTRAEWLRQQKRPTLDVLDRLRPRGLTDADFLIGLVAAMPGDDFGREAFFDQVDPPFILLSGRHTPERSTARFDRLPAHYAADSPNEAYADIRAQARRAPANVTALRGQAADELVRLARISMITRERDLAVFQYANPRDAFLVDDGDGLAFGMVGALPDRRALLPATYGGLTLQNGVPIGYVQLDVLGRHAALSFNLFPAFRQGQAAYIFARLVAVTRHVFGCNEFSIEPYQLGAGNDEGIESGAWWFYHRQGFRPGIAAARRLAARETARKQRSRTYRSSARTLRALAASHLFLSLDPTARARLPRIDRWLDAAVAALAPVGGADPVARQSAATSAAQRKLGAARSRAAAGARRAMLDRWAGLVLALMAHGRWSGRERRELRRLIESKAGASEREFQRRILRFRRLRKLLDC